MATVELGKLFELLHQYGPLLNRTGHPIETMKPGHGNCCTCQKCGWPHDECCCTHNEFLEKLKAIAAP